MVSEKDNGRTGTRGAFTVSNKKDRAVVLLGVRIGVVFLAALCMVIFVAYHVILENMNRMLADYSIQMMQSMVSQGVDQVERELQYSLKEAGNQAKWLEETQGPVTPKLFFKDLTEDKDVLRVTYVSPEGTVSSGKTGESILADKAREDIRQGFLGKSAVYGPCFNEDGEYIVCFSAPVYKEGQVAGVVSIEKNGYLFCDLIREIRFADSGESYIINEEGTDVAVSEPSHIDWVNSQYNGRRLLKEQEDPTTRSIVELEQNGLDGKTGVGTYYWDDGLCYLAYEPIPSNGWVLLAGVREEEIAAISQNVLLSSYFHGIALKLCFVVFLILSALIACWIVVSMRKNAQINRNLEKIANQDALTGLYNRYFLENDMESRWKEAGEAPVKAAVLMLDIDDFKRYNDGYGHQAGDVCLQKIAQIFIDALGTTDSRAVRYGGEEYTAVIFFVDEREALEKAEEIRRLVREEKIRMPDGSSVTVSIGVCHMKEVGKQSLHEAIECADHALYQAKNTGKDRVCLYRSGSMIKKD